MPKVSRLKSLLSRVFGQSLAEITDLTNRHSHRRSPARRSRRARCRIQSLEDRALLAVFTVTTTADSGAGSLRDAITQANVDTAADTIEFNIPGLGPHTIQPLTPLPAFASRILVDGFSQPSFAGTPRIFLNGSVAGGSAFVLPRTGNWPAGSEIRGLAIGNWSGIAIDIQTSAVTVVGNYIGTDTTGQTSAPNGTGISLFFGGVNNRIGTDGNGVGDESEGNVISGNSGDGIRFTTFPHSHVTGTVVAGNRIGVGADGVSPLSNGGHGIQLRGSSQTQIGGNLAVERNIISGNSGYGIAVVADQYAAHEATILGNYIGTDASGTTAVPNQFGGILVDGGSLDTVIGVAGSRNLISGNTGPGIRVESANGVHIAHNFIGTDVSGTLALPNQDGIDANNSSIESLVIGTNGDGVQDALEGNLVSGNLGFGIVFGGAGNVVAGNTIGLDVTGSASLPNRRWGIEVFNANGAAGPLIGTNADGVSDTLERNVISTNTGGQIFSSNGAARVTIAGNYIGTNAAGTRGFENQASGIQGSFQQNLRIGGGRVGQGNLISGNNVGVEVNSATSSVPVIVAGNKIGTDATGMFAIPNNIGVRVSEWVIIGTNGDGSLDASEGNVISGNDGQGVLATNGSRVAGNFIGVGADGIKPLGNGSTGIEVDSGTLSLTTVIGTNSDGVSDDLERNVIGFNQFGIATERGNTSIRGNYIGVLPNGSPIPNVYDGIKTRERIGERIDIGGDGPLDRNFIQFNSRYGISSFSNSGGATPIPFGRGNIISQNIGGAFGFSIENIEWRTDRNYPVFTSLAINGGLLTATGFARAGQVIELYESGPTTNGFGEGRSLLTTFVEGSAGDQDATSGSYGPVVNGVYVGTDTTERFRFVVPVPDGLNEGMLLASLGAATNDAMSVFSPSFLFGELGSSLAPTIDPISDVTLAPGGSLLQRGAFVDPDSVAWTATVNYGDGTGVRALQLLSDFQFDLEHEYTTPGTYTVTVSITDNSLLTAIRTFTVSVENDTPEAAFYTFNLTSPIVEGDTATLTGEFSDALSSGSYFVDIDWGNGQTSTIPLGSSVRQFTATHVYRDDFNSSGSATASDVYEVSVTIREVGGNSDPTPAGVLLIEVQNSVPNILSSNFSSTSVNEGDTVTLDLSFEDLGLDDSHEIKLDWGDGTVQFINPAVGVRSLNNLSHTYLDTPRNGDPDYIVSIELTDDDEPLNPVRLTRAITVTSPAPTNVVVNNETGSSSINEGGLFTIGGSFTDPGSLDSHLVVIDWGDGRGQTSFDLPAGVTSFSGITHQYVDDPAVGNKYTITVQVADTDNRDSFGIGTRKVIVNNVAPVLGVPQFDSTTALEGDTVMLSGSYSDVGIDDRHTVIVTWADGTQSEAVVDATARTYQASHTYRDNGPLPNRIYNVSVGITDDGGLADTENVSLRVNNVAPDVEFLPAPNQNNALAVELRANVFDPGSDDVLTYAWQATASGQSAQIGNQPTFLLDRSAAPSAVFFVTLFVTDSDGGSGSYSLQVQVGTSNADNIVLNNNSFPGVTDGVLILGLGGDDIIDATGVTNSSIRLILDGGSGQDILYGGSGDDIYILANGDDSANTVPFGSTTVSTITPNTAGNDRYILTPNSILTVFDDQGGNTLDFERASFGVKFDLAVVSNSNMISQDVATPGTAAATHYVAARGAFGNLVGSTFGDDLTAASNSTVSSGAGNDTLRVKSNTAGATFHAGADNDVLFVSGTNISNLSFGGDAGLDSLINTGSIAGLTFSGGADRDILQNIGTITSVLNFGGDAGLDILTNSGSIAELTFSGGADRDIFVNNGATPTTLNFGGDAGIELSGAGIVGTLNFGGDAGADIFVNLSTISTLTFSGGADADIFVNNGTEISWLNFGGDTDVLLQGAGSISSLSFGGDDGADSLLNFGTVSTLTFNGGADNDVLRNTGTITTSLNFGGDSGLDALLNSGTITNLTFNGGADADIFLNNGTAVTSLNFGGDADILVAGAGSVGTLNFGGDGGADLLVNLSTISTLTFTGGADNDTLINHGALPSTLSFGGDTDILLVGVGSIATLNFGGDGGMDRLINDGAVTSLTFNGGADSDTLINTANNITTLNFGGDGGADVLINSGMNIATLNFGGDEGLDLLTNSGSIGTLVFTGGADADVLRNTGNIFTSLNFGGDSGSDLLVNEGSISSLTFTGGADGDVLANFGTILGTLSFGGDGGSDLLFNEGTISSLTFTGGADRDVLTNYGHVIGGLSFGGDAGADSLSNFGTIGSLTFNGGADADVLQNLAGSIGTLNFGGDAGSDSLINRAMVTSLTFVGGADDDKFLNTQDGISILRFFGGGTSEMPLSDPSTDGDDLFVNTGRMILSLEVDGGAGDDVFQNLGGQITTLRIIGGAGNDAVINSGSAIGSIRFDAGGGDDVLLNSGELIGWITFIGDDSESAGNDVFILRGSGTGIPASIVTFTGGDGQDSFHNTATSFSSITFTGGYGDDVLVNAANGIGNVNFYGGPGDDILENRGHSVSNILFEGNAGIDLLVNTGNNLSAAEFVGGAQDDLLVNLGRSFSGSTFTGNDGADRFENHGEFLSAFVFDGGTGENMFRNHAANLDGFTLIGGDDVDTLINLSGGVDSRNIQLRGHGGDDRFLNAANRVTAVTFIGDEGADGLLNTGSFVSGLTFTAGGGNDVLINDGDDVSAFTFDGDDGSDAFRNTGRRLTNSTIRGGAGSDTFESLGDAVSGIDFFGGDAADSLFLRGSSIGALGFDGGNGDDSLESYAISISQLTIQGGAGNDEVRSHGPVTTLVFYGGSGNDTFTNTARTTGTLNFFGEDDEDTLISRGGQIESLVANLGNGHDAVRVADSFVQSINITTGLGRDAVNIVSDGNTLTLATGDDQDSIAVSGQFPSAIVDAGSADDTIILSGGGNLQVAGGSGDDTYFFVGSELTSINLVEAFTGSSDTSTDTLNFSAFRGGALDLDLSSTSAQSFGGFTLVLSDSRGVEDVVGTSFSDVITGNARNNLLSGADYSVPFSGPVAARRTTAQWVLLDFETYSDVGEFQYSTSAKQAILDRLSEIYHGPDAGNPWFKIFFTTIRAQIPFADFITVYVNQTPESGRPGGLASEIDPGNLNPGGSAVVQINGLLGGIVSSLDAIPVHDHGDDSYGDAHGDGESPVELSATDPLGSAKPSASSANFIQLTSKIIAHEVGHLLGLRHQDSFGPIGFGINITPGIDGFKPAYAGPVGAIETFNHISSSPASVGSTRFDDLTDLYFGEREIIKLVAAMSEPADVTTTENTALHSSISNAQPITLATLELPNTIARGLNSGDTLSAAYLSVLGRIDVLSDGNGGLISESDFYSFTAKAGDVFTFEVMSNSIAAFGSRANDFIDSILRVYSADGQLVPYYGGFAVNDDMFEPTDSALFDLIIPSDGTYYIEVDTFHRSSLNGLEDPSNPLSPLNPQNPNNILDQPELLKRFMDSLNDTDSGRYQLIVYAFRDATSADGTNIITGNGGTDIILGGSSTDTTAPISRVQALPQHAQSLTFDVTVNGEDPAAGSAPASGVAFYHIYVAMDQNPFQFWRTISADSPTTSFTAESNRIYWFRSVAEDFAGNLENEPTAPDTHTIVGDLDKPESQIIAMTDSDNGLIELTATGIDLGGGVLQTVEFYVSIDGAAAMLIGTVAAATQPNGTRAATFVYQGLIDGTPHTYAFYSVGIDSRNNVEDEPSVADQILTRQFDPPAQLQATGIDVQRGANQRSFIQYLDLMFSDSQGLQNLLTNNRVRIERFSLDASDVTIGMGATVSLGSASINGNIIQLNFGAQGIGGNRSTDAGNGFYRISIDTDGDGDFDDQHFEFFRLFGDADGNGTVNAADSTLINGQFGRTGTNLDGDIDGDRRVSVFDRLYASRNVGKKLRIDLFDYLDD